jgi:hypothetical protein
VRVRERGSGCGLAIWMCRLLMIFCVCTRACGSQANALEKVLPLILDDFVPPREVRQSSSLVIEMPRETDAKRQKNGGVRRKRRVRERFRSTEIRNAPLTVSDRR